MKRYKVVNMDALARAYPARVSSDELRARARGVGGGAIGGDELDIATIVGALRDLGIDSLSEFDIEQFRRRQDRAAALLDLDGETSGNHRADRGGAVRSGGFTADRSGYGYLPEPDDGSTSDGLLGALPGVLGDRSGWVREGGGHARLPGNTYDPYRDPHPPDGRHTVPPPDGRRDTIPDDGRGSDGARPPPSEEDRLRGEIDGFTDEIPVPPDPPAPPPPAPPNTNPRQPADPDAGPTGSAAFVAATMPLWLRKQERTRNRRRSSSGPGGFLSLDYEKASNAGGHQLANGLRPSFVDAPTRIVPRGPTEEDLSRVRRLAAGVGPGGRPVPPMAVASLVEAVASALLRKGYRV